MTVLELGYVGVGTPEASLWRGFGPEVLGAHLGRELDDGGVRLDINGAGAGINVHPSEQAGLRYLGWQVQDRAALEAIGRRLGHGQVAVRVEEDGLAGRRGVDGLISFTDARGYRHEVFHGPHCTSARHGDQSLQLGHVFLLVPDLSAAEAFYTNSLGLGVSDHIDFTMGRTPFEPGTTPVTTTFLFAGTRHHALALAQLPSGFPDHGLAHLMLEVDSIDRVGHAYDACAERECLVTTLGRHTNDRTISFYLSAPGGIVIEYGWGGRAVDDAPRPIPRFDAPSLWGHRPIAS